MADKMRILGFAGSLRKGSYNRALLRTAVELAPEDAEIEVFELDGFPGFSEDLEDDPPQVVVDFKAKIRAADAILIVTPEYNYSMPGVLKNAIDWASRPYGDNVWDGKPLGIMGASMGMTGTARAQYHLRQSCVFVNMLPLNRPEVMVPFAQEKVNEAGEVTDQHTRDKVRELLAALVAWTRRLRATA
jgi:chromate reductase